MRRIGVIGGGLSGLTVAFRRARAGDEVVVIEGSSRLGGQLWTERRDGFVVEHGAEGFVARSEAVPALAEALGIGGALIGQTAQRSWGWNGAELIELGPGEAAKLLGFQVPRDELGKGIRTFERGMGQLADALASAVLASARVRLGARVASVARDGAGLRILVAEGAPEAVDAVVVATGAVASARILEGIAGASARALEASPTLSSVTVTLAYPRAAVAHSLDGTGLVVAQGHQLHGFRASTFITSKFEGRAPGGHATLRLFFRPEADDLASLSDDAWTARAEESLARVLPITGRPLHAWVSRWGDALPVFTPDHVGRVRALEAALGGLGVLLAGAAFHGSGIDAAVRSAEAAARALDLPAG